MYQNKKPVKETLTGLWYMIVYFIDFQNVTPGVPAHHLFAS
jgi:hypothetical protein